MCLMNQLWHINRRVNVGLFHACVTCHTFRLFRVVYRVKRAAQVLPVHFLEFEFRSLVTLDVSPPSCEVCEVAPATVFCPAEKCHLCVECDHKHHTAAKLLSRHKRLPVTHVREECSLSLAGNPNSLSHTVPFSIDAI